MRITATSRFKLNTQIHNAPKGATGQLKKLDACHVALLFDDYHEEDLVLDLHDTDPAVWAAIEQNRPYARGITRGMLVAVAIGSFALGWITVPQPMAAHRAIEEVLNSILPL